MAVLVDLWLKFDQKHPALTGIRTHDFTKDSLMPETRSLYRRQPGIKKEFSIQPLPSGMFE